MRQRILVVCLSVVALTTLAFAVPSGAVVQAQPRQQQTPGQNDPTLRLAGRFGGPISALVVRDGLAYASQRGYFTIYDVTDDNGMRWVGAIQLPVGAIALAGDYAYVSYLDTLTIVNVANPAHPRIAGTYTLPENIGRFVIADGYIYVVVGLDFVILQMVSPTELQQVGAYGSAANAAIGYIAVDGNTVFLTIRRSTGFMTWHYDLELIDVSNRTAPRLLTVMSAFNEAAITSITAYEHHIYVLTSRETWTFDTEISIAIVDITEPSAPVIVSNGTTAGRLGWGSIHTFGRNLYFSWAYGNRYGCCQNGLAIYDLTQPAEPRFVGEMTPDYDALSAIAIDTGTVYLAPSYGNVQIVDVRDTAHPTLRASVPVSLNYATEIAAQGDYLYVADSYFKSLFRVVDVSQPHHPTIVATLPLPQDVYCFSENEYGPECGAMTLEVRGDYAYVVGRGYDQTSLHDAGLLRVIDIRDPLHPVVAGQLELSLMAEHMALVGQHAYIATYNGLQIVDVSTPTAPAHVADYKPGTTVARVATSSTHAFVVYNLETPRIEILDITTPGQPQLVGTITTAGVFDLAVSGNHLYAAAGDPGGLQVYDITDPRAPVLLDTLDTESGPTRVIVDRNIAYVLGRDKSLYVVDVSQPDQLREVGAHTLDGNIREMAVAGNHVSLLRYQPDSEVNADLVVYNQFWPENRRFVPLIGLSTQP